MLVAPVRGRMWKANTQRSRAGERGVTLIEMLMVVSIMALIAGAVAVAAFRYWQGARLRAAETSAREMREAVKGYWLQHDDSVCPTVDDLMSAGILDEAASKKDPWGSAWHIECAG